MVTTNPSISDIGLRRLVFKRNTRFLVRKVQKNEKVNYEDPKANTRAYLRQGFKSSPVDIWGLPFFFLWPEIYEVSSLVFPSNTKENVNWYQIEQGRNCIQPLNSFFSSRTSWNRYLCPARLGTAVNCLKLQTPAWARESSENCFQKYSQDWFPVGLKTETLIRRRTSLRKWYTATRGRALGIFLRRVTGSLI